MEPYLVVTDGPPGKAAFTCIALSEVLRMRAIADQMVRGMLAKDPEASAAVDAVFKIALTHGAPGRPHAMVSAHLIRDAYDRALAEGRAGQAEVQAQAQPKAAEAAAPAPEVAGMASPSSSEYATTTMFVHPKTSDGPSASV